jgi:hypothetical protein
MSLIARFRRLYSYLVMLATDHVHLRTSLLFDARFAMPSVVCTATIIEILGEIPERAAEKSVRVRLLTLGKYQDRPGLDLTIPQNNW